MKLIEIYTSFDSKSNVTTQKKYINIELIDKVTILECKDKTCNVYCTCFFGTERQTEYLLAIEFNMKHAIHFVSANIGIKYDYHNNDEYHSDEE